jgi:uncharacterized lipoprotein YehR (DUF1307 family)
MKKAVYTSVVLLVLAVGILGCGKSNPKEVALNWLTSVNHMDFETAKKYSTDDTKRLLSEISELTGNLTDSTKKELKKIVVSIKDVKIDSNTALVTYVTSDNPGKDQTLDLVQKDNQWLVRFTKGQVDVPIIEEPIDSQATTVDTMGGTTPMK